MEPNQDNKTNQPVSNKPNQPTATEEKKQETNAVNPADNQEKKVQPVEPVAADNKKIGDVPDTKEPQKEDEVKGETAGDDAPAEEKEA